jgi:nucleoside-diphosphate-sugar epimerase
MYIRGPLLSFIQTKIVKAVEPYLKHSPLTRLHRAFFLGILFLHLPSSILKMVNVLVVGATGYIGQALASSLVRSGSHRVYGLARTETKATLLTSQEIVSIIGDINSSSLVKSIESYNINVVVDVSGANQESRTLLTALKALSQSRLAAAAEAGNRIPKLGFIYTSGTWVHGSSLEPVNDLTPVGPTAPTLPTPLTAWRPQLEQEILAASDVLDTMIIRPALVYGRSSAIWTALFEPLLSSVIQTAVSIPVEPTSRPALVHVDDVASGLHAAVDNLPRIAGTCVYPVFDLCTSQESMRDILEAAAGTFGFQGKVELAGAENDLFMQAMSVSGNLGSGRAKQILGWVPRKIGFVSGMEVFGKAFVAGRR